jgi:hypothetical protein
MSADKIFSDLIVVVFEIEEIVSKTGACLV